MKNVKTIIVCLTILLGLGGAGYLLDQEIDLQRGNAGARWAEANARFQLDVLKFKTETIFRAGAAMKGEPKVEIPTETPTPTPKAPTVFKIYNRATPTPTPYGLPS
jgi:hypothetical protein